MYLTYGLTLRRGWGNPGHHGAVLAVITGVSCPSPAACLLVATDQGQAVAAAWNGQTWRSLPVLTRLAGYR